MTDVWEERISCATGCERCSKGLEQADYRILSVYDHKAICMECKKKEEKRPDYDEVSKSMIGQCIADVDQDWQDPEAFCYHHFYPYKC